MEVQVHQNHEDRYVTLIWVPHARARFRKLKIPYRLATTLLFFIVGTSVIGSISSALILSQAAEERRTPVARTSRELEQDLSRASMQMVSSVEKIELAARTLVAQQQEREKALLELTRRYERVSKVTAGQEALAETYREILTRRPLKDRVIEQSISFTLGVLSSLVASILWFRSRRSEPLSAQEKDSLDL